jgi:uncharacterized membrane protein YeaQ/YmgE (transglycosylase-associated protein family)
MMRIIAWIIVGLIAGFTASKILNKSGEEFFPRHHTGDNRAVVGGEIFHAMGHSGLNGVNLYSILVAVIGAIVVLVLYHVIVGRRSILSADQPNLPLIEKQRPDHIT